MAKHGGHQQVPPYAMDLTVLLCAAEEPPALMCIYAPCVDCLLTEHKCVLLEHLFPLSTPLHTDRWKTALHLAGP